MVMFVPVLPLGSWQEFLLGLIFLTGMGLACLLNNSSIFLSLSAEITMLQSKQYPTDFPTTQPFISSSVSYFEQRLHVDVSH